jgi:hypothetical protein
MRIEEQVEIRARAARVWTIVSNPARYGKYEAGLTAEPHEGSPRPELHARYRATIRVGPIPVGGDVEIVEFVPRREFAWTSLTGIDQRLRLRVRDLGDGRTRLVLRFGYSSAGPLGYVADVVSYGRVREIMRHLIGAIKTEAERPPRRRSKQSRKSAA